MNRYVVPDAIIERVGGYFTIYASVFLTIMLLLMTGMNEITAFGAVAASMNNLGPGLGDAAANFASVGAESKLILVPAMLLGRLEILTLLVLVIPSFWRN